MDWWTRKRRVAATDGRTSSELLILFESRREYTCCLSWSFSWSASAKGHQFHMIHSGVLSFIHHRVHDAFSCWCCFTAAVCINGETVIASYVPTDVRVVVDDIIAALFNSPMLSRTRSPSSSFWRFYFRLSLSSSSECCYSSRCRIFLIITLSCLLFHRLTPLGWIHSWGSGLNCRWLTTWETTCKTEFSSLSWLKLWVSLDSIYTVYIFSLRYNISHLNG